MIAVDQTTFGSPHGDCLPACLASILHLSIADVPRICEAGEGWLARLADWLRPRGLAPLLLAGGPPPNLGDTLCIVSGASPRGPWLHATVWRGRHMVHDPHPSRAGLESVVDTLVLVPLDPRVALQEVSCG